MNGDNQKGRKLKAGQAPPVRPTRAMAAALFGIAFATKNTGCDVVGFGTDSFKFPVPTGSSILRVCEAFCGLIDSVGSGTNAAAAVIRHFDGHDRVIVISDEQVSGGSHWDIQRNGDLDKAVPANVPLYAFNVAGYAPAAIDTTQKNRYRVAGLTGAAFTMIAAIEQGRKAQWPWESAKG